MSDEAPRKHGGQTVYTQEAADEICRRLAEGETLRQVCRSEHLPGESTVRNWVADDREGFSAQYARAREAGYVRMAEELLEIADDGSNDWMERENSDGSSVTVVDHEHIQRSRLRVETRKWILAKALPKIYGEKIQIDARHEHVNGLSDAELERIASGSSERASEATGDPSKLN
jgi:hypothetical protein